MDVYSIKIQTIRVGEKNKTQLYVLTRNSL